MGIFLARPASSDRSASSSSVISGPSLWPSRSMRAALRTLSQLVLSLFRSEVPPLSGRALHGVVGVDAADWIAQDRDVASVPRKMAKEEAERNRASHCLQPGI